MIQNTQNQIHKTHELIAKYNRWTRWWNLVLLSLLPAIVKSAHDQEALFQDSLQGPALPSIYINTIAMLHTTTQSQACSLRLQNKTPYQPKLIHWNGIVMQRKILQTLAILQQSIWNLKKKMYMLRDWQW